jgi:hypothetical protein
MLRNPIIDRAAMNAEQARVYDTAKAAGGPVGGLSPEVVAFRILDSGVPMVQSAKDRIRDKYDL